MTFSQFLSILAARKWIGVLIFLLTVGATLGVSLLLPKQYSATASIVIDVKPDPIAGVMYPGQLAPAYLQTQVDILQSDRVAQRVVRNLKLADNPQVRQQWLESGGEGTLDQWLSSSFQKALDAKPSRESNLITVSFRGQDPKFAAALANAFVQAYLDTAVEMRVDPAKQVATFFDARSKSAREALEAAQAKLSAFQRENGLLATDERLDVETSRMNELSAQLVTMQSASADSRSRQTQAQAGASDRMQEVLGNTVLSSYKVDLSRLEAKLQELLSRYGDNHPQVIETRANINELRARLESETRRVTGGVTVSNSINKQREGEIRAAVDAQRAKLLKLKAVRDEGAVLMREVENAQRTYDTMLTRLNQTSNESLTTQGNAYVLSQASPPLQPSSPKVVLNTTLSALVGVLLALGAIMAMEFVDRRIRTPDDLPEALGLPVLGVMPRPGSSRLSLTRNKPALMQQRIVGQLPGRSN